MSTVASNDHLTALARRFMLLVGLAIGMIACAEDTGLTPCLDDSADGRRTYRQGWTPTKAGFCPTAREVREQQDYDEKARELACDSSSWCAQRRDFTMLLNQPSRPAPAPAPRHLPEPFGQPKRGGK